MKEVEVEVKRAIALSPLVLFLVAVLPATSTHCLYRSCHTSAEFLDEI
jgi:hypothetical protein